MFILFKKNTFELNAPDEYHKHFESPPLTRPQNTLAQEIILEPKRKKGHVIEHVDSFFFSRQIFRLEVWVP